MKILTIGEVLVEIVATTRGEGFLEAQALVGPFPSGAPAIFIDQVGKLGVPCAIVSRVGDDDFGMLNLRRLQQDGVDVSGIAVAKGEATGSAFVRYREDGSRRFVFNIAGSACGRLEMNAQTTALIAACSHLHVMGSALSAPGMRDVVLQALVQVKARGGIVSFDPNARAELLGADGMREVFLQVLGQCDIFLPSGEELYLLSDARSEDAAVAGLLARGVREVALKRGAQGASVFTRAGRTDAAALKVDEIDPTGAGDCFGGAYIAMRARGCDVEEALRYANAAGAHAVTRLGPMEGSATLDELKSIQGVNR